MARPHFTRYTVTALLLLGIALAILVSLGQWQLRQADQRRGMLAALVVYMNPQWRPRNTSNYGELVTPQRPMPTPEALALTTLDGKPFDLRRFPGKWLLVAADGAACPESGARKRYITRNTHASQGKNVGRLARVWFIIDDGPVAGQGVLAAYRGTVMLRADPDPLARYLLARAAAADGAKVREDIGKRVYRSRIG